VNLLFVTLDQYRGDCLSLLGHEVVRTPSMDALGREGVCFSRHYSQAAPCAPGRACLYTGTYQMHNRVLANGTPLDDRLDNVARMARRLGYEPTLFGYSDQGVDPRLVSDRGDPRLSTYEGVLPGLTVGLDLSSHGWQVWREHVVAAGYDVPATMDGALSTEPERPEHLGISAFLTDSFAAWLHRQDRQWFAHLSYLRPHPPYAAAGRFAREYDPDELDLPVAAGPDRHPFHELALALPFTAAPTGEREMRRIRSQYYGMVANVDEEMGRLRSLLEASGQWEETIVVVTADHGEQLGDHGLLGKLGFFEQSYHVPAIVRDPSRRGGHGLVVKELTEAVDLLPTICELLGAPVGAQLDGLPLTAYLDGSTPPWWRSAATWEFDWSFITVPAGPFEWPWDRRLDRDHLTVRRSATEAYVHFGDGSWRCYDLAADPTWRTETTDPGVVLSAAQAMLAWREENADRTLTGFLLQDGGTGRWPEHSIGPASR